MNYISLYIYYIILTRFRKLLQISAYKKNKKLLKIYRFYSFLFLVSFVPIKL